MGRKLKDENDLFWEIIDYAWQGFKVYMKAQQKEIPKEPSVQELIKNAKAVQAEYKVLEDES